MPRPYGSVDTVTNSYFTAHCRYRRQAKQRSSSMATSTRHSRQRVDILNGHATFTATALRPHFNYSSRLGDLRL